MMRPKHASGLTNSVDPDNVEVWSGYAVFAQPFLYQYLDFYGTLCHSIYFYLSEV